MVRVGIVLWAALLAGPTTSGWAQPSPLVEPGIEVRVYAPNFARVALVARISADTLTVVTKGSRHSVALPINSIQRLDRRVRVGVGRRALKGAKWGALVGAAYGVGGLVMAEGGPGDPPRAWWPLVGVAVFTPPTMLAFMAIPAYRWEPVPLPKRTQISVRGNGVRISVRL